MLRARGVLLLTTFVLITVIFPSTIAQEDEHWSENEIDPSTWSDGPDLEGRPMDESKKGNPVVKMQVQYVPNLGSSTVEGEIILELFQEWVPITTTNFISLAEESFWDGIFFHRVIDDFVAQSGDPLCKTVGVYPTTSPNCGDGGSGETIPLEHEINMSHVDGAIGMARGLEEDSAESQFYLCDGAQHQLDPENRDDGGYATFGIVRDGMSHVRAIAAVPTSNDPLGGTIRVPPGPDRPIQEVQISSIEMIGIVGGNTSGDDGFSSPEITDKSDSSSINITWIMAVVISILTLITAMKLFTRLSSKSSSMLEPPK
jgi:peptidyl-prolyl cis-trans isomerase B (cyclophilin B)